MDANTRLQLNYLHSDDADIRYQAYQYVMHLTAQPVTWAYEIWDDLLLQLKHKNNHQRAIASQVLSNLAKSDPENRMEQDIDKITAVTYDERFVTARHTLLSLWNIALCGKEQLTRVTDFYKKRFAEAAAEKNCTLIRFDIIQSLRKIYDELQDTTIKDLALLLISNEPDEKYRKKYNGVWKDIWKAESKTVTKNKK
jgi:hypothetical protein